MSARFSIFRELRGYDGFEAIYQGTNLILPLSPYDDGLDPQASQELSTIKAAIRKNNGATPVNTSGNGIHPFLWGMLPSALGSTIVAWIPQLGGMFESGGPVYLFLFFWRMRAPQVNQQGGTRPFHSAFSAPGEDDDGSNDTSLGAPVWQGNAERRFIIPCASEILRFVQSQPAYGSGMPGLDVGWWTVLFIFQSLLPTFGRFPGPTAGSTADACGTQGFAPNPSPGLYTEATHVILQQKCMGDEVGVVMVKPSGPWDFDGEDAPVSRLLGRGYLQPGGTYRKLQGTGVLVATGTTRTT